MKIFSALFAPIVFAAHLHNTWACENETEDIKPVIAKFSTQRQETMEKPFEKHFHNSKGDDYFLNAKTLTLSNKDYPWYIHEDHRKILSDREDLRNQVLDELNKVEKKSFQDLDKIMGFSLDICGDEVSINPYPSRYAENLSYAHTSIMYLSSNYFHKLVDFCKSDFCDLRSRTILFSLFSLVPTIINRYPLPCEQDCVIYGLQGSSGRSKLALDFGIFLKNSCRTAHPLVLESNAMLFNRVGKLISNFDDWMGNK